MAIARIVRLITVIGMADGTTVTVIQRDANSVETNVMAEEIDYE